MCSPTKPLPMRLCPLCRAAEEVADAEPLWPIGWRCDSCGHVVEVADGIPQYAAGLANSLTGMNPAAFDEIVRREEGNFWFEPRSRLLVGLADKFFPGARRYLEIGCGTGAVLTPMASTRSWTRIVGSEIHPAGLVHARQRLGTRAEFVQMDARNIPARTAFDLVGAFDVIEHIAEDEAVLEQIHRALLPGGGFLVAVPQHPRLWSEIDDLSFHQRRYRRGELESKLRATNFEVLYSTSYTALLLPLMIASRLFAGKNRQDVGCREFDIDPKLNAAMRFVLQGEVALTLRGISWPAGGSRVVVARKPSA
jgi:SAM-dependent methyltransferase